MKLSNESGRDHESVIFSCFLPGENLQEHRMANHAMVFVCEGQIDIFDKGSNLTVKKGEYVFLKRDCQIRLLKHRAQSYSKEEIDADMIGNLCLISRRNNSSLNDKDPHEKIRGDINSLQSKRRIMNQITKYENDWNKKNK